MNNETLMKIASKVIENRIRQQQALELLKQAGIKENVPDINKDAFIFGNDFLAFLAGIPGASGTAAGKAKELASHGAGAVGSAAGTAAGKAKELASHGAGAVGSAAGTAFESAKGLAGRGAGTAFESAKGLAGRGAGAARDLALKVKTLTASGAGTAAEWGSKGLSAVRGVGSKILANPYARYGGLGAGVLGAADVANTPLTRKEFMRMLNKALRKRPPGMGFGGSLMWTALGGLGGVLLDRLLSSGGKKHAPSYYAPYIPGYRLY